MSAIFKKLNIEWKGETVKVTPTFRMINDIEESVNLALMANRISTGDIRFSHVAMLYSLLLKHGGLNVTPDEVYSEMFTGYQDGMSIAIASVSAALDAFYPQSESQEDLKKNQN